MDDEEETITLPVMNDDTLQLPRIDPQEATEGHGSAQSTPAGPGAPGHRKRSRKTPREAVPGHARLLARTRAGWPGARERFLDALEDAWPIALGITLGSAGAAVVFILAWQVWVGAAFC
jgi:hypothetical protein